MEDEMKIDNPIRFDIVLPSGNTLEVDATPEFMDVVRRHYELESIENVKHEHVRMYIYGACKGAIDKAEAEMLQAS